MKSITLTLLTLAGFAANASDLNRPQHCEYVAGQAFLAHPALAAAYNKEQLLARIEKDTNGNLPLQKDAVTAVHAMYDDRGIPSPMAAYSMVYTYCIEKDEHEVAGNQAITMR